MPVQSGLGFLQLFRNHPGSTSFIIIHFLKLMLNQYLMHMVLAYATAKASLNQVNRQEIISSIRHLGSLLQISNQHYQSDSAEKFVTCYCVLTGCMLY